MRPVALAFAVLQPCSPLRFEADPPERSPIPGLGACTDPDFVAVPPGEGAVCSPGDAAVTGGAGYASVQEAVDAAPDASIVFVCPGTHTGTVRIDTRTIALASADREADGAVLDGVDGAALDIVGSAVTVADLTFRGSARSGGGAQVTDGALFLSGVVVRDATATTGAGVSAERSAVEIEDSTFVGNVADESGGALALVDSCAEVRGSTFLGNVAVADVGGGAITFTNGTEVSGVTVRDSTFEGNSAGYEGGAIQISGGHVESYLDIAGSTFVGNDAGYSGGAVVAGAWGLVQVVVSGSSFEHNHADYEGGAISTGHHGYTFLTATDNDFVGNSAGYGGGAIAHGGWSADTVAVSGGTFTGNDAPAGTAISVEAWEPLRLTIDSATFDRNTSTTDPDAAWVAHDDGFLQGVAVDFVGAGNHVASECGTFSFGLGASFTCDAGTWSKP